MERSTLDVYRYHNVLPDGGWNFAHFTIPNLGAGWLFDGPTFKAYYRTANGAVPIHRFYRVVDFHAWFYQSLSPTPIAGWTYHSLAFYGFAAAVPALGTIPVYQHHAVYPDGKWRYLNSLSSTGGSGWTVDGIAFHALP